MENLSRPIFVPRFNFLLQSEFPMNALILAADALRISNQNSGKELFRWCFVSEAGEAVRASNQMWFGVDHALDEMPRADVYLLFGGNLPTQNISRRLLSRLREAARFGAIVGGVDTGAFALARSGLICNEGERETIVHWEAEALFREEFPASICDDRIFRIGGNRAHCAGGVATLDMMLDLITRLYNEALANEVANALIHTRRSGVIGQRGDTSEPLMHSVSADRLIEVMEANLDFPLSLTKLAETIGIPERSLVRLCRRNFGESPMRLYLHTRLQAARNFLFYEEYPIKEVANACGFSYQSVFSRCFKERFGQTPQAFRAGFRDRQRESRRPELRRLISSFKNLEV